MAHHIFQLENELQNIPEAAPSSRSFSVSERLARYGSSTLSGVEHLRLLVGKDSIADALLRHFGSLKALSRASFKELRQFLPKGKAEAVMAALSMSNVADAEHALSAPLNNAEAIYRANLDMKGFHQEVVRVVLLDAQHRCITRVDIARGTVNESLAAPVRFSGRQLFTRLSHSCWCTITHQAQQTLPKRIYSSPSASRRLRRFFKSISWITSSSAGVSSVSRKQDFCNNV
jgi:RadC-like JAB domain